MATKRRETFFAENIHLTTDQLAQGLLRATNQGEKAVSELKIVDFLQLKLFEFGENEAYVFPDKPDIRALIDIRDRRIGLYSDLAPARRRFSIFHEVGHYVLPSHRDILYKDSVEDLSPRTRLQLEIEANSFAANCIFPHAFTDLVHSAAASAQAIIDLADKFKASYEATAWRYVEKSNQPCALIVYAPSLDEETGYEEQPLLAIRYSRVSEHFKHFTYLPPRQTVPHDSELQSLFYDPLSNNRIVEGYLGINDSFNKKVTTFRTEAFSNSYRVFQLVLDQVD